MPHLEGGAISQIPPPSVHNRWSIRLGLVRGEARQHYPQARLLHRCGWFKYRTRTSSLKGARFGNLVNEAACHTNSVSISVSFLSTPTNYFPSHHRLTTPH